MRPFGDREVSVGDGRNGRGESMAGILGAKVWCEGYGEIRGDSYYKHPSSPAGQDDKPTNCLPYRYACCQELKQRAGLLPPFEFPLQFLASVFRFLRDQVRAIRQDSHRNEVNLRPG